MAIYIRRIGEIADGSVTEAKLADSAVDLSNNKVTGQLPSAKLADGSVIEAKLASLAVSTGKLADSAVSLAKAQQAMKIHHFIGDENEVSVLGVTETDTKYLSMPRSSSPNSGIQATKLHINAEMKVTGSATGTLKVYVDAEGTARITLNTTSNTYEMVEGNADISDLSAGKHDITMKMFTDDGAETVYNDLVEIFLEK